jgi:hypothetical protein
MRLGKTLIKHKNIFEITVFLSWMNSHHVCYPTIWRKSQIKIILKSWSKMKKINKVKVKQIKKT